jgi:hypothetical protein
MSEFIASLFALAVFVVLASCAIYWVFYMAGLGLAAAGIA